MKYVCHVLVFVLWLGSFTNVQANNLILNKVELLNDSTLMTEISWENSWNLEGQQAPYNHDAVWIFIKARTQNLSLPFAHVELSTAANIHQDTSGILQIEPSDDGMGLFVRRKQIGEGAIPPTRLYIRLKDKLQKGSYTIKIFGIEMVYVPSGAFSVGDSSSFHHFRNGNTAGSFKIENEASIAVGSEEGKLFDDGTYPPFNDIPDLYPKGFGGIYCMKYEISQEQYVAFLNCLSYPQQNVHTQKGADAPSGSFAMLVGNQAIQRNGIVITQSGIPNDIPAVYGHNANEDAQYSDLEDGQNRACNFLNWNDVAAFLDWAALRPMSELEFEKISRGPDQPTRAEFAWGTSQIIDANNPLQDGTELETVSELADSTAGLGSHGYITNGLDGPLRCGFGGKADSDRLQIGGSYFGITELSGNLWELCVNVDSAGLLFIGTHGNGSLDSVGESDVTTWPTSIGAGHRGGALNSGIFGPYRDLAISDRFYAFLHPNVRRVTSGGRGVRSFDGYSLPENLATNISSAPFRGGKGDGHAMIELMNQQVSIMPLLPDWIEIYPNPAWETLYLELSNFPHQQLELEVFDPNGRRVIKKTLKNPSEKLDVSSWTNGLYLIQLSNETSFFSHLVLIQSQ